MIGTRTMAFTTAAVLGTTGLGTAAFTTHQKSRHQIVQNTLTVPAKSKQTVFSLLVDCPAGWWVTGGGGSYSGQMPSAPHLTWSAPLVSYLPHREDHAGRGWRVDMQRDAKAPVATEPATITAYAICVPD